MGFIRGPHSLFTSTDPRRHRERHTLLAEVLDPFTQRRLADAGIGPGSRCLEIGAGSGSVAAWMAEQVGPSGQVIATDLDITGLPDHPGLTRVEHDITTDPLAPLSGGGGFDIVHARLVISHFPSRWAVIGKLAAALNPGGALVIEEFDGHWSQYVRQSPDTNAYSLFADYHEAMTAALETADKDLNWELFTAMTEAGLVDVDAQMWSKAWRGGQPGCLLLRHTIELEPLREALLATGIPAESLDELGDLLADPGLVIFGHPLVSTIGRRPTTGAQQPTGRPDRTA